MQIREIKSHICVTITACSTYSRAFGELRPRVEWPSIRVVKAQTRTMQLEMCRLEMSCVEWQESVNIWSENMTAVYSCMRRINVDLPCFFYPSDDEYWSVDSVRSTKCVGRDRWTVIISRRTRTRSSPSFRHNWQRRLQCRSIWLPIPVSNLSINYSFGQSTTNRPTSQEQVKSSQVNQTINKAIKQILTRSTILRNVDGSCF